MTYTTLINETLQMYLTDEYEKAYEHITKFMDQVEGNRAQLYNFRYAIACAMGNGALGLELLEKAIVDEGLWYAYDYLMEDDDLESIREHHRFKELAQICKEREEDAKSKVVPEMDCILISDTLPNPKTVLMAVHGNQEDMIHTEKYWKSALATCHILAMPQSSQIEFSHAYNWDDSKQGTNEIIEHVQDLYTKRQLSDKDSFIMGAFSAGADVCLNAILKGDLTPKGFICVGPWLPNLDDIKQHLSVFKNKSIKVVIICGTNDEDCLEGSKELARVLEELEVSCISHWIEGMDHEYPSDFDRYLANALEFIEA